MKQQLIKFTLTVLVFIIAKISFGQVSVTGPYNSNGYKVGLKPEDYQRLKKSTLYFVIPEKLMDEQDMWQSYLDSVWNYSVIEVISMNEYATHVSEKNASFFSLAYAYEGKSVLYCYMQLMIIRNLSKKIDEFNMIEYARINLDEDCEMQNMMRDEKRSFDQFIKFICNKASINNFKPGIFANYLKLIETALIKWEVGFPEDSDMLKRVKTETLFITDNVMTKETFPKCKSSKIDENKLMEKYPYPYQIISFDDLNSKLLNGEDFIYAIFSNKRLSGYDSLEGIELFSFESKGYEGSCVPKDFKILADKIDKGK